jgi:hypothetical protein
VHYGPQGQHLLDAAQQAFVDAAHSSFYVAIGVLVCGAVFAAVRAPRQLLETADR